VSLKDVVCATFVKMDRMMVNCDRMSLFNALRKWISGVRLYAEYTSLDAKTRAV
jgi:hypothetical protein